MKKNVFIIVMAVFALGVSGCGKKGGGDKAPINRTDRQFDVRDGQQQKQGDQNLEQGQQAGEGEALEQKPTQLGQDGGGIYEKPDFAPKSAGKAGTTQTSNLDGIAVDDIIVTQKDSSRNSTYQAPRQTTQRRQTVESSVNTRQVVRSQAPATKTTGSIQEQINQARPQVEPRTQPAPSFTPKRTTPVEAPKKEEKKEAAKEVVTEVTTETVQVLFEEDMIALAKEMNVTGDTGRESIIMDRYRTVLNLVKATDFSDATEINTNNNITGLSDQNIQLLVSSDACNLDLTGACILVRDASPTMVALGTTADGKALAKAIKDGTQIQANTLLHTNSKKASAYSQAQNAAVIAQLKEVKRGGFKDEPRNTMVDFIYREEIRDNFEVKEMLFVSMNELYENLYRNKNKKGLESTVAEMNTNGDLNIKQDNFARNTTLLQLLNNYGCYIDVLEEGSNSNNWCLVIEEGRITPMTVQITQDRRLRVLKKDLTKDFSEEKANIVRLLGNGPVIATINSRTYAEDIQRIITNRYNQELQKKAVQDEARYEVPAKVQRRLDRERKKGNDVGTCWFNGSVSARVLSAVIHKGTLTGTGSLKCRFSNATLERKMIIVVQEGGLGINAGRNDRGVITLKPENTYKIFASGIGYSKRMKDYACEYASLLNIQAQIFGRGLGAGAPVLSGCKNGAALLGFTLEYDEVRGGIIGLKGFVRTTRLIDVGDFALIKEMYNKGKVSKSELDAWLSEEVISQSTYNEIL